MKNFKRTLALFVFAFAILLIAKPVSAEAAAPKLNKSKLTVIVGQQKRLKVKNNKKKVKWSSSAKKIVAVDSAGYVKGKKEGAAVITAKVGSKKLTCKVTVKEKPELEYNSEIVCLGGTKKLKVLGTAKKVTWKSSKPKVVKVNKKGVITGKKLGKATITAKVGKKTLKCKVVVNKAVEVYQTSLAIENGGVIEVDYYSNNIIATSADPSIAKVYVDDYGMYASLQVYGVKTGTTTIAIANDCNKEVVNVKVTVNKPEAVGEQLLIDWIIQNGEMTDEGYLGVMETDETMTHITMFAYDPELDLINFASVDQVNGTTEACATTIDYRKKELAIVYMSVNEATLDIQMLAATINNYETYTGEQIDFIDMTTFGVADAEKKVAVNNACFKAIGEVEELIYEKTGWALGDLNLGTISISI